MNAPNFIWQIGLLLTVCGLASGCVQYTWQDSVYQTAKLPETLRLTDRIDVSEDTRWLLPADSRVCMVPDEHAPTLWMTAARRGLDQYLRTQVIPGEHCTFHMAIIWPEQSQGSVQHGAGGELFGINLHPGPLSGEAISVHIFDQSSQPLTRVSINIAPRWFDADPWHAQQHIEQACMDLARSLTAHS